MLLNLPRELRDMIYSHVMKGTYRFCAKPRPMVLNPCGFTNISPNLSLLTVCKTISAEAMVVLYSESSFRIHVHLVTYEINQLSSIRTVERMMNTGLGVKVRHETANESRYGTGSCVECLGYSQQNWDASSPSSRTNSIRRISHVGMRDLFSEINLDLQLEWSHMDAVIPYSMFQELKSMTRTRTVVLEKHTHKTGTRTSGHRPKGFLDKYETTAIRSHLTRVLGSANAGPTNGRPYCVITLTFPPRQPLSILELLKAPAADPRAKADELDLEAKRAEEGMFAYKAPQQGKYLMGEDVESTDAWNQDHFGVQGILS